MEDTQERKLTKEVQEEDTTKRSSSDSCPCRFLIGAQCFTD